MREIHCTQELLTKSQTSAMILPSEDNHIQSSPHGNSLSGSLLYSSVNDLVTSVLVSKSLSAQRMIFILKKSFSIEIYVAKCSTRIYIYSKKNNI